MNLLNYKATIAYDGSAFFGWQKTHSGPSIEETLQQALEQLLGHSIALQAASRTDRGVHAEGQIVNFFTSRPLDKEEFLLSINRLLPPQIALRKIEKAAIDFHPTLHALGKEYHYRIFNNATLLPFYKNSSWHIPQPLLIDKMQEAIPQFLGRRDFFSLSNSRFPPHKETICTLQKIALIRESPHLLILSFTGDHFLYKMVRNLAGALAYIGLNKLSQEQIPGLFSGRNRSHQTITAPASGLILKHVFY